MAPKPKRKSNKNKKKQGDDDKLNNNKKLGDSDVYEVHQEIFMGRPSSILCRKQPGPCPLLAVCNLLLLRDGCTDLLSSVDRPNGTKYVSAKKLQAFVLDRCTQMMKADQSLDELDRGVLELKFQEVVEKLRSTRGMHECVYSVNAYVSTISEANNMFRQLGIARRHAILSDPKNTLEHSILKDLDCTYMLDECFDYLEKCQQGESFEESYRERMAVIIDFIFDKPKFTPYGMGVLREEAGEKELFLLVLDDDLHVVYKRDGQLYLLATEEELRVEYPDIMWFGLDENFNAEDPARNFTNTFAPVKKREKMKIETPMSQAQTPANEGLASTSEHFLQELEAEKSGGEVEIEKAVCQVEPSASSSEHFLQVVDQRFLRFLNRAIVSFETFSEYYEMSKIYDFKGQKFPSTSFLGRSVAKDYLESIFDVHKSGFSWNGRFKKDDMMVEMELMRGEVIRAINCFIKETPNDGFGKKQGVADLDRYVEFLFPRFLCEGFKELPFYFVSFEADIRDMPELDEPLEKLERYHKYMRDHLFLKAPLVRSTLVSDLYGLCNSEIFHTDQTTPKPRYGPLDIRTPSIDNWIGSHCQLASPSQPGLQLSFSEPLMQVYVGSRVETHTSGPLTRWTCWDLIELGRHAKQHLMDKTQDNGVQEMDDPIIIDLIIEQDLKGRLTESIKRMMQITNFEGRFESTWRHFRESEAKDVEIIPLLIGDNKFVKVAEPGTEGMQAAAKLPFLQPSWLMPPSSTLLLSSSWLLFPLLFLVEKAAAWAMVLGPPDPAYP